MAAKDIWGQEEAEVRENLNGVYRELRGIFEDRARHREYMKVHENYMEAHNDAMEAHANTREMIEMYKRLRSKFIEMSDNFDEVSAAQKEAYNIIREHLDEMSISRDAINARLDAAVAAVQQDKISQKVSQ